MKGYLHDGIVAHVHRSGNCTMVLLKALVPVGKFRVEASAWGGCRPDPERWKDTKVSWTSPPEARILAVVTGGDGHDD
jgi:hypothetical protein